MIREARAEDAHEMMRIYNQAVEDQVYANCDLIACVEEFAGEYLGDRHRYVAFVNVSESGAISGWGALKPCFVRPRDERMGEVSVYVDRSRRSAGLGVRLLQRLVAHAETMGFRSLLASIAKKNTQSLRGSKGCGFEEIATLPGVATIRGFAEDMIWVERLIATKSAIRTVRSFSAETENGRQTDCSSLERDGSLLP